MSSFSDQLRSWAFTGAVASALLVAGCGGGSSSVEVAALPTSTVGTAFRATMGAVVIEYDADGAELQRSQPTDDGGRFEFSKAVVGERVQVLRRATDLRSPTLRSARVRTPSEVIEVTPLTTLFDQLVSGGLSQTAARGAATSLIGGACGATAGSVAGKGLFADTVLTDRTREWLLRALDAYLFAFRNVGLSSRTPGIDWLAKLKQRSALLGQMCGTAEQIFSDAWLASTQQTIATHLAVSDTATLAKVSLLRQHAADEVLALMGTRLTAVEYPEVPAADLPSRQQWIGNELNLAAQLVEAELASQLVAVPVGGASEAMYSLDRSGRIVRALFGQALPSNAAPAVLRFENSGTEDRQARLIVNDRFLTDYDGLLDQVLAMPVLYVGEPLWQRAWRFVVDRRQHAAPISEGLFLHQPDLFLRSMGFGYCDDTSSTLHWIWRGLGFEARVVGLWGHVVAEVRVGDRWELYDPDYAVYYFNRTGVIASVNDIANDGTLLWQPFQPILSLGDAAYDPWLATFYTSQENNSVQDWYSTPTAEPMDNVFTIPRGGYLELTGAATETMQSVTVGYDIKVAPARLWFPPGYTGTVELPMILSNITGDGSVSIRGQAVEVTEAGVAQVIHDHYAALPDVGLTRVQIDRVGPAGLMLTMAVNPLFYRAGEAMAVGAYGTDLSDVTVTAVSAPVNR